MQFTFEPSINVKIVYTFSRLSMSPSSAVSLILRLVCVVILQNNSSRSSRLSAGQYAVNRQQSMAGSQSLSQMIDSSLIGHSNHLLFFRVFLSFTNVSRCCHASSCLACHLASLLGCLPRLQCPEFLTLTRACAIDFCEARYLYNFRLYAPDSTCAAPSYAACK